MRKEELVKTSRRLICIMSQSSVLTRLLCSEWTKGSDAAREHRVFGKARESDALAICPRSTGHVLSDGVSQMEYRSRPLLTVTREPKWTRWDGPARHEGQRGRWGRRRRVPSESIPSKSLRKEDLGVKPRKHRPLILQIGRPGLDEAACFARGRG